jgi:hypothetical protein
LESGHLAASTHAGMKKKVAPTGAALKVGQNIAKK